MSGTFKFSFNYASKLGDAKPGPNGWPASSGGVGGAFNSYPLAKQAFGTDTGGTPGTGLPFNVVATQVGKG